MEQSLSQRAERQSIPEDFGTLCISYIAKLHTDALGAFYSVGICASAIGVFLMVTVLKKKTTQPTDTADSQARG